MMYQLLIKCNKSTILSFVLELAVVCLSWDAHAGGPVNACSNSVGRAGELSACERGHLGCWRRLSPVAYCGNRVTSVTKR